MLHTRVIVMDQQAAQRFAAVIALVWGPILLTVALDVTPWTEWASPYREVFAFYAGLAYLPIESLRSNWPELADIGNMGVVYYSHQLLTCLLNALAALIVGFFLLSIPRLVGLKIGLWDTLLLPVVLTIFYTLTLPIQQLVARLF